MTAKQRAISIKEFAEAMFAADSDFAGRVKSFEERFGTADPDTLAVLAQAAYFCWGNSEYENNVIEVCRAVGRGKPTSFFYHGQIKPDRWALLNSYVAGVQSWLGVDIPLSAGIDGEVIERIDQWLGKRSPAKNALAELFLCNLVPHLLRVNLTKLGENNISKRAEYTDFTQWYTRPDGTTYGDGHRDDLIERCRKRAYKGMGSAKKDAKELIEGILQDSPPPCIHRFTRYLDIQITSIGALKWRGNLPPDDTPKERWIAFLDEAQSGLRAWIDGALPRGNLSIGLHRTLGRPTERSKAMVRDFLLAEDRGTASDWLGRKAKMDETTAGAIFRPTYQGKGERDEG